MGPENLQEEAALVAMLRGAGSIAKVAPRELRQQLDEGMMPSEMLAQRDSSLIGVDEDVLTSVVREIADWRAKGIRVMFPFSEDYPEALLSVFDYPLVLFGTGHRSVDAQTVSVVGSRKASERALALADEISAELAASGVTIASGLARGVDTAAHEAALRVGGRTVAVLGHGAGRIYPKENAPLLEKIRTCGGEILTQFWPGSPPTKQTFPMRNVTMSGLSGITVIVEAEEKSGTRHQAFAAVHHGHYVLLHDSVARRTTWGQDMVSRGLARSFQSGREAADHAREYFRSQETEPAFA